MSRAFASRTRTPLQAPNVACGCAALGELTVMWHCESRSPTHPTAKRLGKGRKVDTPGRKRPPGSIGGARPDRLRQIG